jgi:hypothetical protein
VRDQFIVSSGGLGGGLSALDVVLVSTISTINQMRRKRRIGDDRAFVLGDEVAEADYTSLGHWSGVSRGRSEKIGRRDS